MSLCAPPDGAVVSSFAPSYTAITPGTSTNSGVHVRLGRWIETAQMLVANTGFVVSTDPTTIAYTVMDASIAFHAGIRTFERDSSASQELTGLAIASGISYQLWAMTSSGTYSGSGRFSATVPFTWATPSDQIGVVTGQRAVV